MGQNRKAMSTLLMIMILFCFVNLDSVFVEKRGQVYSSQVEGLTWLKLIAPGVC